MPTVFSDTLNHVRTVIREIDYAIGAIEMATGPDINLLGGYSGAQATKELREARRLVEKARERIEVVGTAA